MRVRFSLRPPKFMELNKYNNLLELFNFQFNRQDSNNVFLKSLKDDENSFTWQQTFDCIQKLSDELNINLKKNERCLLISENRPEWLISDLAIMLTKGITVPAYTTYTKRDYEYLIDDCKPSVIIVSDQIQYDKIDTIRGLDITITTSAKNDEEARALLKAFSFPLKS